MKKLILILFVSVAMIANGQNFKLASGSLAALKDQTEVNVELNFDNVLMMKENITEAQYLENRKNDLLANPKRGEAGWKKWSGEWEKYKKEEYIQYFLKGLNKSYKKIKFDTGNAAKYTIVFDTKWVFPGWHAGMIGMSAEINGSVKLVETNNPSNVLAEVQLEKFDKFVKNKEFVMEYGRIAAAYEAAGKYFVKEMKKSFR